MKVGDLVKIYPKDGAISSEVGVYLGEHKTVLPHASFWASKPIFLVNGQKKAYCKIDYNFEIIKKN